MLRQHEGTSGAFQRRNRPLSHVPVGAFSPKALQWSNEEQVKSVLALFCPYVGSTPILVRTVTFCSNAPASPSKILIGFHNGYDTYSYSLGKPIEWKRGLHSLYLLQSMCSLLATFTPVR